ncbi:SDR family NAD(P)-dependent oxidoreductase [Rubrobacter marinus]|uniref:NADP-dependent 3-hydroxy acid dehydrogenase YdfG n=1 Tax=Rubrobacter marinus TaxID=2653852 RepID=A0A6G8PWI7_9ACTN|nr:SDR family oxidoreductase [Rubrobacter marinus]QIN78579.1 SDR family NAD(P)-dependent oxidoreductase [Rubrobacter marinus]
MPSPNASGRGQDDKRGRLGGKVAVVTGASSGIGAAVAGALAAEGAGVALAARRADALREVQAGLVEGAGSIAEATDVTDREGVRALVARAERELGPVDFLVNCAGVMYYTLMKNLREEEWEGTVEVNCKGTLNCVGAVLPGMLSRGGGHIVTISSDAGRKVYPGLAVYSASKFFVEALSQGLRLETAGTGVRVTTVQPGNVDTGLASLSNDEEAIQSYGEPTGARVLDPEDVAASVLYALAQPDHVAVNEILVQPRDEPA